MVEQASVEQVLRDLNAHQRLVRALLTRCCRGFDSPLATFLPPRQSPASALRSLCAKVVGDEGFGASPPLPDGLLDSTVYDAAVDVIEAHFLPLVDADDGRGEGGGGGLLLGQLARSILLTLALDKESSIRALCGAERERLCLSLKDSPPGPTLFSSASKDVKFIDNVEDLVEVVLGLGHVGVVAIHALNHSAFARRGAGGGENAQGTTTFVCLCVEGGGGNGKDCTYLIDMLAQEGLAVALLPLFKNPLVPKVCYGPLHQPAQNLVDVLYLADLLECPVRSIRELATMLGVESGGGDYLLHDSIARPISTSLLQHFVHDCQSLLKIAKALQVKVSALVGGGGVVAAAVAGHSVPTAPHTHWPLGYRKLFSDTRRIVPASSSITHAQDRALGALWSWRHKVAAARGVSEAVVASNACLLFLAFCAPTDKEKFARSCGLFPVSRIVHTLRDEVLACLVRALDFDPGPVPKYFSVWKGGEEGEEEEEGVGGKRSGSEEEDDLLAEMGSGSGVGGGGSSLLPPLPHTPSSSSSSSSASAKTLYGRALATPPVVSGGAGSSRAPSPRPFGASSPVPYLWGAGVGDSSSSAAATAAGATAAAAALTTQRAASPVQRSEDVFRFAGWSTPTPSPYDNNDDDDDDDESTLEYVDASRGDEGIKSGERGGGGGYREGGAAAAHSPPLALPDTFEEIFEISNRNRKRNKDSGQVSSSMDSFTSEQPVAVGTGTAAPSLRRESLLADPPADSTTFGQTYFPEGLYFSGKYAPLPLTPSLASTEANAETSEAALDLALTLGWVHGAAAREDVKRAHLSDLAAHSDVGVGSGQAVAAQGGTVQAGGGGGGGKKGGAAAGNKSSHSH